MKKLILSLSILATSTALAGAEEELFSIQEERPIQASVPVPVAPTPLPATPETKAKAKKAKVKKEPAAPIASGNLPIEFVQRDQRILSKTTSATVLPTGNIRGKLKGLKTGDIIFAKIPHSIMAFPNESAPVVAEITDGPFKSARLLGASRLEPNSKRIFIDFKYITTGGETYEILANAVTAGGQTGFEGEYHSQEAAYFAGDFISSFTAAYFDGLVPRAQNVFGTVVEDWGPGAALKKGMAGGAMSTAERFREKLKKVPEFSELKGPTDVGLLIVNPGVQR